jgi:hypothetical protein
MVRCVLWRSGLLRLVPAFPLMATLGKPEGVDLNCLYFKFRGWACCQAVRNGQF